MVNRKNLVVLSFICVTSYFLNINFASAMEVEVENKENCEPRKKRPTSIELCNNSSLKRVKNDHILADQSNSLVSLHTLFSPITAEKEYLLAIRLALIQNNNISSPEFRKTSYHMDEGIYLDQEPILFQGKTVYRCPRRLYDHSARVLNENGDWETNLDRMKRGACPIANKGTIHSETASIKEILANQRYYRIELHHWTKKDSNTPYDPIIEITYAAHMGKNARFIVEEAPTAGGDVCVVHSSLDKEQALKLCKEGQIIKTNILHEVRKGNSLINRDEFNAWRIAYWKHRAEELEKENLEIKAFTYSGKPIKLYQNCDLG